VSGQGSLVQGNEYSSLALGPEKNIRIGSSLRKVAGVAEAHDVEWIGAASVVLLNSLPEYTAREMLVQQIAHRHASHRLRGVFLFDPP
jgi:hypothetical protein